MTLALMTRDARQRLHEMRVAMVCRQQGVQNHSQITCNARKPSTSRNWLDQPRPADPHTEQANTLQPTAGLSQKGGLQMKTDT